MFGLWFTLSIAVICFTILCAIYLCLCSENETGIFAYNSYEERLKALETKISKLEMEKN